MAAKSAHLTANQQNKPSIFELIAAESLNQTFYPAIKRFLNFIVTRDPEKLSWILRYYDEIYLILNGILQSYYLSYHNGSLSEVFYGLSRYSVKSSTFEKKDRYSSIITLVILPYIKIKLDQYLLKYNELNIQRNYKNIIDTSLKSYKIITSVYDLLKLAQYVLYISSKSPSHSPLLKLFQLGLEYNTNSDEEPWTWRDLLNGEIGQILSILLFRGLEVSAFFLQFIQWWETESKHKKVANLPIPETPDNTTDGIRYMGICPICLQKWRTPTVLSISGFVYCYKCIINHFEKTSKTCPVTLYPATIDDLIRLYDV